MKTRKPERTDRTSMTFPAGVWRAYSAWCRQNGWYPSHRISVFLEKELERAGIDWRADESFADVEVGNVKKSHPPVETVAVPEPTETERAEATRVATEYFGEKYRKMGWVSSDETTESPREDVEVQETEEDEFAAINKMFKL